MQAPMTLGVRAAVVAALLGATVGLAREELPPVLREMVETERQFARTATTDEGHPRCVS